MIVAIAGNAVEHAVGIVLAAKGRTELAISVVKNSVAPGGGVPVPAAGAGVAADPTPLTFALAPVYTGALLGTAVIVWQITGDGEATPFEGAALIAAFVILATVAAFEMTVGPPAGAGGGDMFTAQGFLRFGAIPAQPRPGDTMGGNCNDDDAPVRAGSRSPCWRP